MLKRIEARNFKAFGTNAGLDISLSQLSILLGQNNAGKTSAIDVVAVLAQTARQQPNTFGLLWSGDLVDLGLNGEHARHNGRADSLRLGLDIMVMPQFWDSLPEPVKTIDSASESAQTIGYRVFFSPSRGPYQHEFLVNGHVLVRNLLQINASGAVRPVLEVRDSNLGVVIQPATSGAYLLAPELFSPANLGGQPDDARRMAIARCQIAQVGTRAIRDVLARKTFFVGADRSAQSASLESKFTMPDVGRRGQHTLQVLSTIFAKSEYRSAASKIREWAQTFGLSNVTSGWAGQPELHSGYDDAQSSAPLPVKSAGFGSQQILPVIVQLFAAPDGSSVFIEEPEISLHPAAQVSLKGMLADAVNSGRQVVITTHSQYLVMALQDKENRDIQPGSIAVYHFSRDQEGSKAVRLPIDDQGMLRGWIPSFSDVEQHLLQSWMTRVHDKLKGE